MKDSPKDDGLRPSKLAKLPVEQLSKLLGDGRGEIRAAAADALLEKGREGRSALIAALSDFKIRTRINALWGLASLETALARKQLTSALDDAASPVRAEATRLVGPFLPFDE